MNRFTLLRLLGKRSIGLCALAVALVIPTLANATFVATLSLTNDPSPTGTNFGTVTVDDSISNQVTITFAHNPELNGGLDQFQGIAFNTSLALLPAHFTSVPTNWTVDIDPNGITGLGPFGTFDVGVSTTGTADRLSTVVIVIEKTDITAADFLEYSDKGDPSALFAAHYIPGDGGATWKVGAIGPSPDVESAPAPSSMLLALFGIAFAGGFHYLRRRRTQLAVAC